MKKIFSHFEDPGLFLPFSFLITALLGFLIFPTFACSFDYQYEGRFRAGTLILFDPPPNDYSRYDNEVELRNGLVGTLYEHEDGHIFDYEVVGDWLYTGGIREETGIVKEEHDLELFRGWLRYEKGNLNVRAGRQQILFGAASLFRPLGFYDTRVMSGIIPLTRGVDAVRPTYHPTPTSTIQGWAVHADNDDRLLYGMRAEGNFGPIEAGIAGQYHPVTDLQFLTDFDLKMAQMGYHLKGEKTIGFWHESRLDILVDVPGDPIRLDTVFGVDYTFDVGQGLHVLVEYFLRAQEPGFINRDLKQDRTIEVLGLQVDQPVSIDIVWRAFFFFDLTDQSFQFVPQVEYNIVEQIYLYAIARIGGSVDGDNRTGRLYRGNPFFYTGTESGAGLTLVAFF